MELKYKLTRAEFQDMGLRERQRNGKLRKNSLFFTAYMAFVAFFAVYMLASAFLPAVIAAAIGSVAAHFWFLRLQKAGLGRIYDLVRTDEQTQVRLDAAGLYLAREHIRSEIDWEAISVLTEDEIGFYLTYAPLQSLYVPRRVFASAAEAQQFWALAQEYRQFARPAATEKAAIRVV